MAKNPFNFVTGAVAGVALGVAASLFMQSQQGKKLQKEVENSLADFYKYISPKLKKIEKMSRAEYKEFMDKAVDQYAKVKKLSESVIHDLKATVEESWDHFANQAE